MVREADFAYRQAFALGPWAHEAVFRYEEFLKAQNRPKDALLLLESAAKTNPGDKRLLQRAEDSRSE
jgi:tetratricopeptide (TPR) repeat protein